MMIAGFLTACKPSYNIVSSDSDNVLMTTDLPVDSAFVFLYMPYTKSLNKEMDVIIGRSAISMVKNKPESPLTNFLADLILEETTLMMSDRNIKPDVAFLNYGGIRTGLPEGNITVRNIFEIMPFENELVMLKLKGSIVQEFLDLVASYGGDSLSGIQFKIKNGKATDIFVGGKPLNSEQFYWLATSDYIADGGDKFAMLQKTSERVNSTQKIRDLMINYLKRTHKEGKIIDPKNDGRISHE